MPAVEELRMGSAVAVARTGDSHRAIKRYSQFKRFASDRLRTSKALSRFCRRSCASHTHQLRAHRESTVR